jgi:hypothetical protein
MSVSLRLNTETSGTRSCSTLALQLFTNLLVDLEEFGHTAVDADALALGQVAFEVACANTF